MCKGSSPRMRGALRDLDRHGLAVGIIPAYAGSTLGFTFELKPTGGSSPRMRGARLQADRSGSARGIIPAYAGSTAPSFLKVSQYRDHPRVCGEHSLV